MNCQACFGTGYHHRFKENFPCPNGCKPALPNRKNLNCDWCGELFVDGEVPVSGYEDQPTHKACARDAKRAWREDVAMKGGCDSSVLEREPFTDWPNGQGTYD